jgi:osmoprotectant transport system ATP-binding protein
MLKLEGVTKSYGTTPALGPLDLALAAGSTTVVLGPSGCGKSTLLRIALGLIEPTSGKVHVGGIALSPTQLPLIRRRTGYVTQDGGLFPHLTARANTTIMARQAGWSDTRIADRLHELSALTSFPTPALGRFPGELSGGQRQRVALMRALMLDPDLLLLDEPLGALDPLIRYDLQEDLSNIFADAEKTVVFVTHDLTEAAHFADEVVLLENGTIAQRGPFSDLLYKPASEFVSRFVRAQRLTFDTGTDLPPRGSDANS